MTTEIETFVTPDEIIGLRFECSCGTTTTIPITTESISRLPAEMQCPSCPQRWFEGSNDQRRIALTSFMADLLKLQSFRKSLRLGVMLEIAAGVKTPKS